MRIYGFRVSGIGSEGFRDGLWSLALLFISAVSSGKLLEGSADCGLGGDRQDFGSSFSGFWKRLRAWFARDVVSGSRHNYVDREFQTTLGNVLGSGRCRFVPAKL